jgi:predicted O-linked N-acetylglucosamine transferase (SPINDLY family)
MSDEVVSVRADILHAVPNSKLFLKDKQLDYQSGRDQILSRFASFGIAEHRLILEGKSSREEYLACYHRVDIALSPFPYGGGTTSVEGLWMGVPVITKKGTYFLSHLGESIAHNSNLSDWIAEDNEDYIAKAIEFSSDLSALEMLRQSLRENLLKTPLFALPRFANNFEKALWEMRDSIND